MNQITACYIHVPGCPKHAVMAHDYVNSVLHNPGGVECDNLIICQGGEALSEFRELFSRLPNCCFYVHDDSGLDIGGYIAASRVIRTPIMLCMGGNSTVGRSGWMKRMVEAWDKYGPGFYGSLSSFQCRPHFNTSGFWCSPTMLMLYPSPVITQADRYEFEHGKGSCWLRCLLAGFPCKLVTWDGEYDWPDWRKAPNISCRGDQSNCLTYFRINYQYAHFCRPEGNHLDAEAKRNLEYLTDAHIIDEDFKNYP